MSYSISYNGREIGGLYLPSLNELIDLRTEVRSTTSIVNTEIASNGGVSLVLTHHFWSSTEESVMNAEMIDFGINSSIIKTRVKSQRYRVRPIKSF